MTQGSPLGPNDLVLCWAMVMGASFRELVEAAAAAGYAGITLSPDDYQRARAAGLSDADMRNMLVNNNVTVAEFDPIVTWLPGPSYGDGMFALPVDEALNMASAVGARSVNAIYPHTEAIDVSRAVDGFADLCQRAGEDGRLASLEFFPWTGMPDPAVAWEIVRGADQPNGGMMIDSWHVYRGVGTIEALRAIPGERIFGVQLSDAPAQPTEPMPGETGNRLTPGTGDIDLVGLIQLLDEMGSHAPLGVEVISPRTQSQLVAEAATENADALRRILANARPPDRRA